MFNRKYIRGIVAFVWLIAFIGLWAIFYKILPENNIEIKFQQIEHSISNDNWYEAKKSMEELKEIYIEKRPIIQMNNATEAFINFDYIFGQLDYAIQQESKTALEYIGALEYIMDYVVKAFSGP
ncbi:MAG: hypothetical protein AB2417_04305 [Clostridiaceae bacterium]